MKEENKKIEIKKCKLCFSEFEVNIKNKRSSSKIFCSQTCAKKHNGKNNKGKKRSLEYKIMMSKKTSGKNNGFFGKVHSKKAIQKMSVSSLWQENRFKYCNLNNKEKEVLDGLMLSDGCLSEKSRISARLTFGFKFKETCEEIFKTINSLTFSPIWQSKQTKCWYAKSNMYHDLLTENKRWYPKKEKIVPLDVLITKISCYWWFIGDGYNICGNAYLCTDSFTKNDNLFLISKLKENGFNPSLTSTNRIRFDKKETKIFLEWIKPEGEIMEQYKYKWKI